ncbi:MAG: hypothetical protein GX493_06290 [Firmicutes bacterium]|nr:hypothetical protein [Bacillota bacterium]
MAERVPGVRGAAWAEVEEIENGHSFTGKDWDAEVGLYYFNARWYDSTSGRFISEDSVKKFLLFISRDNRT